jgi:iduronate 2-sulfatase
MGCSNEGTLGKRFFRLCFLLMWATFMIVQWPRVMAQRPPIVNILFIVADDMRADIGAYSNRYARFTPNLSKFSQTALTFDKTIVQMALCGPSRNSFLSGRRPDSLRSWNFITSIRKFASNVQTIPQIFRNAGYETVSIGKVFHIYDDIGDDAALSWSSVSLAPGSGDDDQNCMRNSIWCSCDTASCADTMISKAAISYLQRKEAAKSTKPFFLAVGFRRPHTDYIVDGKFPSYDDFPMTIAASPIAPRFGTPDGMPVAAFYSCYKLMDRWQFQNEPLLPWTPVESSMAARVRLAYWRSAAYMDSQLGSLLDYLGASSFSQNTIVVFTSDHGYSLGERAMWCKQSLFDVTTRVPLMIRVPWHSETSAGKRTKTIVELIDLSPTLVSLVGPAAPTLSINVCADGKDLTPLFKNQDLTLDANEDDLGGIDVTLDTIDPYSSSFAISQYPRCLGIDQTNFWSNPCSAQSSFMFMGYSIRTNKWRYTEWRVWNNNGGVADWRPEGLNASELYDHSQEQSQFLDFDSTENVNLASRYPELVSKFSDALRHVVVGSAAILPQGCFAKGAASVAPTRFPSASPTISATDSPSISPTKRILQVGKTSKPTKTPTIPRPTERPTINIPPSTIQPTRSPSTQFPSITPSIRIADTAQPTTASPTSFPSLTPTKDLLETTSPTLRPSTSAPIPPITDAPTRIPTFFPSLPPTVQTTNQPTRLPTIQTKIPTMLPTTKAPESYNTKSPSIQQTAVPSVSVSYNSTMSPTIQDEQMCANPQLFCNAIDWTCGRSDICGLEEVSITCPCWQYETLAQAPKEIPNQQTSYVSTSSSSKLNLDNHLLNLLVLGLTLSMLTIV